MAENEAEVRENRDTDDSLDLALLRRVADRDRTALKALYDRYYQLLLRFIYSFVGNLESAQEGINDVMMVVWLNAKSFQGNSRVRTWILGIAYRKGLKIGEQSRRWQQRFKSVDIDTINEPSSLASEPSYVIETNESLELALSQLSASHRAVVELTYRYGFSYSEIADIVDCPVNTVKTRMFHARAHLKRVAPTLFSGGSL